jgi:hypothetical protein
MGPRWLLVALACGTCVAHGLERDELLFTANANGRKAQYRGEDPRRATHGPN